MFVSLAAVCESGFGATRRLATQSMYYKKLNEMKSLKIGDLLARIPIIQGGMGVGVSLSGLASAVANEGGVGVISVLSNLCPRETSQMCHKFLEGDVAGSRELQLRYLPLVDALFSEVNPIPVKAAMSAMGYCENYLRLPLTKMEAKREEKLLAIMREQNLI